MDGKGKMKQYDATELFEPLAVKKKVLRNRIVMPPMVVNRDLTTRDAWQWYGRRAQGGVGLVIVEATDSIYFGAKYTAQSMRPLAQAIHDGGAVAAVQVFPGRRLDRFTPAQLTRDDIGRLLKQFRLAAEICAAAGFDGIEPHGAHGYVLNQFFSPRQNERTDEYGGATLAGRMRLALEVLEAIRPIARQADMVILYRHTPVGIDYGVEESMQLASALVQAGVDILDISPASDAAPADRAAPFMQLGVPVIAVNQLDQVERALEVIRQKRATLVAVGRGLIADPDWAIKVQEGRVNDIVSCVRCDQCMADLRSGIHVGCPEWGVQSN